MTYINCPVCGHRLMEVKGSDCEGVQVKCRKCDSIVTAAIEKGAVRITVKNKPSPA